jgi:hypothetical protein
VRRHLASAVVAVTTVALVLVGPVSASEVSHVATPSVLTCAGKVAVALSGLRDRLEDHPHRSFLQLRWIPLLGSFIRWHSSIAFQAIEPPSIPGRFTALDALSLVLCSPLRLLALDVQQVSQQLPLDRDQ